MFKLQIFFIRCIFHPFLILFYFFFNLNPPSTLKRQQFHQVENSRTSAGPLQTSARLASVTRGTVEGVELQLHRGSNNGLSLHHKRSYPFNRAMPPFPARSRSGSSPALCKSFGGDAPDRGTRRVSRSVENRPSRASVLINGDELAEISLLLERSSDVAAMSWKSQCRRRKMAGKIGACVGAGSMKSAKWRQERGRRQGESTEKGERPSRKGMKEQSKGAGGRLGGR